MITLFINLNLFENHIFFLNGIRHIQCNFFINVTIKAMIKRQASWQSFDLNDIRVVVLSETLVI